MANPFLGEIKIMAFNFAPRGWALCNGQLLQISQNAALFSLLGTTYGGDGSTTFALPNLQGRVPLHAGAGLVQGQAGGEFAHTLSLSEIPGHSHPVLASSDSADQAMPAGNYFAVEAANAYAATPDSNMAPQAVTSTGGNQPHDNMSPYLVLNFCIALQGTFPTLL